EIDDPELRSRARRQHRGAAAGSALGIVGGAQLFAVGPLEVGPDLALAEGVIAAGQEIQRLKQFLGGLGGDARAAGRVLRVSDAEVEAELVAQPRQEMPDGVAPRLAHDVAHEEEFHTRRSRASVQTKATARSCSPTGTCGTSCASKTSATACALQAASVAS